MGIFNPGEAFLVDDVISLGFSPRRVKLLYDRKMLKLFEEKTDTKDLVETAKEKLAVWLLEKSTEEAMKESAELKKAS